MGRKNYYRKASLWAENCPDFFLFLFGPGQAPKGPTFTEVFSGKFFFVADRKAFGLF
jgi:hypothetical protein